MSEAALLRALADKLDHLDAVTGFPAAIAEPGTVTVTWTEGADHAGYPALSDAIGALVAQHWSALRTQVVKHRETDVQAARAALREAETAAERPSAISANVEAALRKVAG